MLECRTVPVARDDRVYELVWSKYDDPEASVHAEAVRKGLRADTNGSTLVVVLQSTLCTFGAAGPNTNLGDVAVTLPGIPAT